VPSHTGQGAASHRPEQGGGPRGKDEALRLPPASCPWGYAWLPALGVQAPVKSFFPYAIESGLFKTWAEAFPDPRSAPEIGLEVSLPAPLAARFAGLYSMHKAGYVLRSARVLGGLGLQRGGDRPGAWLIAARHLG
jgi:hypothetical protein